VKQSFIENLVSTTSKRYFNACVSLSLKVEGNSRASVFCMGVALILIGSSELAQAQGTKAHLYNEACSRFLSLIEGQFGALITVGAGLGAVVASALGGFKSAWTLVVVSVGAFILRSYITLFFQECNAGTGGPAAGSGN
jgi:hypothetical protein